MAAAQLGININVRGNDFASGALRSAGKSVGALKNRTANFGAAAVRIFGGVTAAIVALKGTLSLTDQFASFEKGLGKLGGILDKDIDQLGELRAVALKAGQDTQFSPTEAIEGLQELASKGFNAAESAKLLAPALDFAAGGGISIADAASSAASAVRVFSLNMDQAGGVAGKLLRITSLTSLKASDMSIALGNISRGAGLAKQSINEMLPIMGLVKNTGVDASVAATSVSSALQFMAKNSKDIKSKLGVNVADANGNFRQMGDIILDASAAMKKKFPNAVERAAEATKLFGKFGVTAFQAVSSQLENGIKDTNGNVIKGAEALAFLRAEMAGAADKAEKFKERMLNTFSGQLTLLKGSAQTFMTVFGEGIAGAIRPGIERAIELLNQLTKWFDALPKSTKDTIGKVVAGFGAFVAIGGIVIALSAAIGLLGAAAAPVVIAFVAVGAAVATVMTFLDGGSQTADGFKTSMLTLADEVGNAFGKIWNQVKAFFGGIGTGFKSIINSAGPVFEELATAFGVIEMLLKKMTGDTDGAASAGATFGKILGQAAVVGVKVFTRILEVIGGIINVAQRLGGILTPVTDAFSDVSADMSQMLLDMGLLNESGSDVSSTFQTIGAVIGGVFVFAGRTIGSFIRFVGALFGGIATSLSGAFNLIKGLITGDWQTIWLGARQIFVGFMKSIIAMLTFIVSQIARAIDAVGAMAGKDIGAEKFVQQLGKDAKAGVEVLLGPKTLAPGGLAQEGADAGDPEKIDALVENTKKDMPPIAPPSLLGFGGGTGSSSVTLDPASISALGAAMKGGPAPITRATLTVDGQVLGTIVAKHNKGGANGGSVPTPVVD